MLRQFGFFVFIWLLEMLEAVFEEGLSIGLIFFVTTLRKTRRRKHSSSVETSRANLAAEKEGKAYKCHGEMSFVDDQGDSQEGASM